MRFRSLSELIVVILFAGAAFPQAQPVYVVHDDPAPMEALAGGLRRGGLDVRLEDQVAFRAAAENRPARAIFMYVHGTLDPVVENRLIRYAELGGHLIVLHHGAASGKIAAPHWLPFLGLTVLPREAPSHAWNVLRGDFRLVNLNPGHYVTSHGVAYDQKIAYIPSDAPSSSQALPAITLPATEIFLNQLFTDARKKTVLMGFQTTIEGRTYTQDRGGWMAPRGKGYVFYFQPGHQPSDFEHPGYLQILLNAVRWEPGARLRRPVVAVDGYHNNEKEPHYRWEGTYPGGFSEFGALLNDFGADTRTVRTRLTGSALSGLDCLIIVDPDTPAEAAAPNLLSNEEIAAVEKWVRAGGKLVLLGNDKGNCEFERFNRLSRRFGIEFLESTVRKSNGDGRLTLDVPEAIPVFARGSFMYVVDVAPLKVETYSRVLLRHEQTPIMAMANSGRGAVVALGDPWIYNEYINSANNRRLVGELFRYLLFDSGGETLALPIRSRPTR